jgi:hypothetical protein
MEAAAFGSSHLSCRVGGYRTSRPDSVEGAVESIAEGGADHTARDAKDQVNECVALACR